jgi:hypothetical protein
MVAAAVFDDDGIDVVDVQELSQQQPGGPGTDNSDLRSQRRHRASILDGRRFSTLFAVTGIADP